MFTQAALLAAALGHGLCCPLPIRPAQRHTICNAANAAPGACESIHCCASGFLSCPMQRQAPVILANAVFLAFWRNMPVALPGPKGILLLTENRTWQSRPDSSFHLLARGLLHYRNAG